MIKLKIKGNELELEKRIAQCSFCGECGKVCVKGSVPVKVFIEFWKPKDEKFGTYFDFGEKKLSGIYDWGYKYKFEEGKTGWFFTGYEKEEKESEDTAVICDDCVMQLAKMIKS